MDKGNLTKKIQGGKNEDFLRRKITNEFSNSKLLYATNEIAIIKNSKWKEKFL